MKIDLQSRHFRVTKWCLLHSWWAPKPDGRYEIWVETKRRGKVIDGGYQKNPDHGKRIFQPKSLCSYFWLMLFAPWALMITHIGTGLGYVVLGTTLSAYFAGVGVIGLWWLIYPMTNLFCSEGDVPADCVKDGTWVGWVFFSAQMLIYYVTIQSARRKSLIPIPNQVRIGTASAANVIGGGIYAMYRGVCPLITWVDTAKKKRKPQVKNKK